MRALFRKEKTFRRLIWSLILCLFILWGASGAASAEGIKRGHPPKFYITECQDDMREAVVNAIREAKQSIYLVIYSLTDSQVIRALKDRADAGVQVTVVHDPTTFQKGFRKLGKKVCRIPKEKAGLMHQKILVIDGTKVWIGSANFTSESLKVDDNLLIGMWSSKLAHAICEHVGAVECTVGGQHVEFWSLPEEKEMGLCRLVSLIDGATSSLRIAMFTWTHPMLTEATIRAHQRGVRVEIVLDRGQGLGICWSTYLKLKGAGIPVRLSNGYQLLHHKNAWIDETLLVNGSANWTKAAFSKNDDCFLILHEMTAEQVKKLERMWHVLRCTTFLSNEEHLGVFGERPERVTDDLLESIAAAA